MLLWIIAMVKLISESIIGKAYNVINTVLSKAYIFSLYES